jgi:hypothetical protein
MSICQYSVRNSVVIGGTPLPQVKVTICPLCHASLEQVGIWSELLEWPQVRRRGRALYILRRWVLGWWTILALTWSIGHFLTYRISIWPVAPSLLLLL